MNYFIPTCTSVSPLKKGGGLAKKSFTCLNGLAFYCEILPPYFLGRAGEGTKSVNYYLLTLKNAN
jgi:hypothetical protein